MAEANRNLFLVIPAKAGIHVRQHGKWRGVDASLRWHDSKKNAGYR